MRSRKSHTISSGEVHQWTLDWLLQAKLLKDHGWKCTAAVVWSATQPASRTHAIVLSQKSTRLPENMAQCSLPRRCWHLGKHHGR